MFSICAIATSDVITASYGKGPEMELNIFHVEAIRRVGKNICDRDDAEKEAELEPLLRWLEELNGLTEQLQAASTMLPGARCLFKVVSVKNTKLKGRIDGATYISCQFYL